MPVINHIITICRSRIGNGRHEVSLLRSIEMQRMFMAVGYEPLPLPFISRNKRGCLIAHNRIRQLLEKFISRCLLVSTMWGGKTVELVNCEHSASIKYRSHLILGGKKRNIYIYIVKNV